MFLAAFMGDAAFYTFVAVVLLTVAAVVVGWVFAGRAAQRRAVEDFSGALSLIHPSSVR